MHLPGAQRRAVTDWLSGLPNRMRLEEQIRKEVERSQRDDREVALIMFDVDHFQAVNDRCRPRCGRLNPEWAFPDRMVVDALRGFDQTGGWGGECFMNVAPETGWHGAPGLARTVEGCVGGWRILGGGNHDRRLRG
ncbi:GGDEF domain-containing protein [Thiohalorhabdus sp.]|uniref:GGDEF domain-containing protein n=1 Tax=Thiohalorhabdus sp. TaxID=3094134 RepID=UPI003FCC4777